MTSHVAASNLPVVDGEFEWNDGMCPGGRNPILWLVRKDGTIARFRGESIPGVCTVQTTRFQKNGKWSNTTYRIRVGTARPVQLLAPLHGKVWGACASWGEAQVAFDTILGAGPNEGVRDAAFEEAVRQDFRKAAERFDAERKSGPLE